MELIQRLCLEAGGIMEDVSADLALTLPASPEFINARVAQVLRAAEDITALANAAQALIRRPRLGG